MPDTFQNASTSQQPSALQDNAAHCPDAQGAERGSAYERRSPDALRCARPSGLPIFSTEKLTGAERAQLLSLQEGYHRAALMIDLSLAIGRVDEALSTLQSLTRDLDGQAAAIAAALGSNR